MRLLCLGTSLCLLVGCSGGDFSVASPTDDAAIDSDSLGEGGSADSAPTDSTLDDTDVPGRDSATVPDGIVLDTTGLDAGVDTGTRDAFAEAGDTGGNTKVDAGGCYTTVNCISGQTCYRTSCEGPGTCRPMPNNIAEYGPVCGCNGVTYWNAFDAANASVATRYAGVCSQVDRVTCNAAPCGGVGSSECIFELDGIASCAAPVGICWVTPAGQICPAGASGPNVRQCNGTCTNRCEAVSAGVAKFYVDGTCL